MTERDAMERALALAATPGVPLGPNPRVGCVLLTPDGTPIAEGFHRGAGSAHAEADALAQAGDLARDATAVVSLEPCNHHGRTPPCTKALIAAGVRRVVYAMRDPHPLGGGGEQALVAAGIDVERGLMEREARALNSAWLFGLTNGRPFVTWKIATTIDGRSAAADGTSRWISSRAARADAHRLRAQADVILAGTATVEMDDPLLTVRDEHDTRLSHQPLRAIMGERELDPGLRVFNDQAETVRLRTRDPNVALADLYERGRRHVFLEGGPTLAAAFVRAGLIDEIVAYVAPMLLGAGRAAIADLGIGTIGDALRPLVTDATVIQWDDGEEPNVRLTMRLK